MNLKPKILAALAAIALAGTAEAGVIIGATSVTTTMGQYSSSNAVGKLINQSGLATQYVSGVTDFDSYVTSTNHSISSSDRWVAATGHITGSVTFNLGSVQTIDAMGLWNGTIYANRAIRNFTLYGDNNTFIGSFSATNASGTPVPGQIFNFSAISTQYVTMNISSNYGDVNFVGAGEAVFDKTTTVVPEPTTLVLLGIAGLGFLRRRKAA